MDLIDNDAGRTLPNIMGPSLLASARNFLL